MHSLQTLKCLEVPKFDRHVCRAGDEQFTGVIEGNVLHRVRMPFECALKISRLVIPYLGKPGITRNTFGTFDDMRSIGGDSKDAIGQL